MRDPHARFSRTHLHGMWYPTVTLEEHFEEHFMGSHVLSALPEEKIRIYGCMNNTSWLARLRDVSVDGTRVKAMHAGGVHIQVLSPLYLPKS